MLRISVKRQEWMQMMVEDTKKYDGRAANYEANSEKKMAHFLKRCLWITHTDTQTNKTNKYLRYFFIDDR